MKVRPYREVAAREVPPDERLAKRLLVVAGANEIDACANVLRRHRYKVAATLRGGDAPELAALLKPNLILLDPAMPGGVTAALALKRRTETQDVPIVFLSGDRTVPEGPTLSPSPCLAKPIAARELVACIERSLASQGG